MFHILRGVHGRLGVSIGEAWFGEEGRWAGFVILGLVPESTAKIAGLRVGDVLVTVDHESINPLHRSLDQVKCGIASRNGTRT